MMDDKQLLHAYARERSESAFGELVARHIDFVYSTALRVVNGDSHLAQDVAQTVFIDLARKARSLPDDVALPGWLHRHTCYTAAKAVRTECRRQSREETAMEMRALDDNTRPEWELVAPYLDESLNQLNSADRDALVLRFLKQQDLRAVGAALGISNDAAQKRVDRALEKLHVLLKHRGATLSATALGTALATEAVTAAPAGLAGTVTAAALAGTTLATTATATATKAIVMTTLQKTLVAATVAVLAGAGIYQAHQAANARGDVQAAHQQQTLLTEQTKQLQHERDEATRQLAALRDDNERLNRNTAELLKLRGDIGVLRRNSQQIEDDPIFQMAREWKAKEAKLRQLFDQRPDQRIPEMRLLTERQWLQSAQNADFDSSRGIRIAMSRMRELGISTFAIALETALRIYKRENTNNLPDNPSQLAGYFRPPVEDVDAMLARYELLDREAQSNTAVKGAVIVQKVLVDKAVDNAMLIGPEAFGYDQKPGAGRSVDYPRELLPVLKAYMNANNHTTPLAVDELGPYTTTPEQKAALDKFIKAATQ